MMGRESRFGSNREMQSSEEEIFSLFKVDMPLREIVKRNAKHLFSRNSKLERYIQRLAKKIERTQLRKFYNYIRSLQSQWKDKKGKLTQEDKLKLLKINIYLAYAVGRKLIDKGTLDTLFSLMIEKIETYEDFQALIDVFEAIIAYHVYYRPKG